MSRTLRFAIPLVLITLLVASPLDAASPPMDLPPAPAASSVGDVVVQPDASGVTLTLTVPSYQIEEVTRDGQAYQHLVVDAEHWTMIGAAGAPQVPGRGLLLAVPPTGNVSLEVLDAPMHDLAGNFRLEPGATSSLAREPTAEDAALQKTWQADPAAYGRDAWTPAAVAEIGQEGWLRGYRFVRLALHPFQFNPAAGTLRVAPELRVRLNFSQVPAGAALPANDPLYASVFRATFANYDQAAAWQDRGQALPLPGAAAQRGESTEPWVKVTVRL